MLSDKKYYKVVIVFLPLFYSFSFQLVISTALVLLLWLSMCDFFRFFCDLQNYKIEMISI